jgi:regulator of protease activity HflC (stomatin/prohibitin superfamily)
MLFVALLVLLAAIACFILRDHTLATPLRVVLGISGGLLLLAILLILIGLTLVNPNHSKVLVLFGHYRGTIREAGFYWINPFTVRTSLSLRVRNFTSDTLKVNDSLGNPIEIAAVVVWKVNETAQAKFDVEDFEDYVQVQTESALRKLAASHPYDSENDVATSLRGSADIVNEELKLELTERLQLAGIEVLEVRLAHLAYAPEIAGAMLQRQQAEAIIAARTRIVDGAVGMVKMALDNLREQSIIDLDDERRAAMVSNLLVVLCSERGSQPVINAGSLY